MCVHITRLPWQEVVAGDINTVSYAVIKHSNNLITKYAHLSQINVKVGDVVKQGDIIGLSGGTPGTIGSGPYTNGAHLHFEVLLNGVAVDPELYLWNTNTNNTNNTNEY